MSRLSVFVALLVGVVVGAGSTWWLVGRGHRGMPAAVPAPTEKKVLYWFDPMVPAQHFDQPGKSPFMDMQLVPKYAGDGPEEAGTVRIEPRLVQNLGVRTALATRGTPVAAVRATGSVTFDERRVVVVQARVAGIVEHLAVRAPLTTVTAGQDLLTLIAPEWTAAQAEYLSLRTARSEGLDAVRAAARQRLLLLGMSEGQIRTVERLGRAEDRITIVAPRAGVVSELLVRDGASVMAGTPLLRINDLDTVWVNAAIPEAQIGRVAPGNTVMVELPAFPGDSLAGTVEALLPDLDVTTRTQTARIVVPNPTRRLVPGMFARVAITGRAADAEVVQIPTEAVIATGARQVVIVDVGDGRFRAQEVRIGDESDGRTSVLEGLDDGDRVVLSGQFLIDSEASLAGTLARLDAPDAAMSPATAAAPRYTTDGTVKQIDGSTWTIATDAIPALEMSAMTMAFEFPDTVSVDGLRVGQRVRFTFVRNADDAFEIATIAALPTGGSP
ncbi:Cu(I)/Ag(I) efflux system membrane fusion protein [Tahibacter aquaticus]|uniref:Cu(I)/Ag(I) efflux system membrane fusion protein n=1 Tax=Tahibacter aquaticus TaxID=520092 RepID=A0A4V3DMR7_9GAMM|nr:efflux RND transporter periplasmic adaptor subunit [Tahibacter aquaticus]TDR45666.1 Cu(I)/Ag(I) efflux system membrane fusion protein [Tahibacter aquaticus]